MPYFTKLSSEDYHLGYLHLLEQLTTVGADTITFEQFDEHLKNINSYIHIMKEINDDKTVSIVGSGTLIIEKKFIHNMASVGHIEDIVIDKKCRGKGYGKLMMNYLIDIAKQKGCYKIILDCVDHNVKFYEKMGFTKKANQMAIYF
jgi:glucosamine-phosphate N-acetyltransferase